MNSDCSKGVLISYKNRKEMAGKGAGAACLAVTTSSGQMAGIKLF